MRDRLWQVLGFGLVGLAVLVAPGVTIVGAKSAGSGVAAPQAGSVVVLGSVVDDQLKALAGVKVSLERTGATRPFFTAPSWPSMKTSSRSVWKL